MPALLEGDRWTGVYSQFRVEHAFNANRSGALEAVRHAVGDTIREAGGHDSTYPGLELKFRW